MVGHVYRVNTGYRMDICFDIFVEFVEIKCAEHDQTLQTVNTELETTTFRFSKIVTCFHNVYNINKSRTTWIHCHVYRVNRGCPSGHASYSLVNKCPVAEPTW